MGIGIGVGIGLGGGGCVLNRALWEAKPLPPEAEHTLAHTGDGWDISLIHYAPRSALPQRRPMLLLHGMVTNERNLDFDEQHSLARWLSARGIDTWAMSLRATGESSHASLFSGARRFDWDLDTYCLEDVPAAIAKVRAATGAAQIDFIGHSLGGMILYCLLARGGEPAQSIAAAATLGSPGGFQWGPRFTALSRTAAQLGAKAPVLSLNSGALLALPLFSWFPEPSSLIFFNPENIDKELWTRFLGVGVEDESPQLARQALQWIDQGRLTSRDGKLDYVQLLAGVRTPLLVVAGKVDQLGFPPLVKLAFQAAGGEKAWLLIAEENGASADYGHMDLVLGDRAPRDVFLPVDQWFEAHSAR